MEIVHVPTLETERLLLRPFRPGDIDDYAALNADPEVLHYLGGGTEPWDRSRSWRHMAFLMGHWQLGNAGMWVLEHKETFNVDDSEWRDHAFCGIRLLDCPGRMLPKLRVIAAP